MSDILDVDKHGLFGPSLLISSIPKASPVPPGLYSELQMLLPVNIRKPRNLGNKIVQTKCSAIEVE